MITTAWMCERLGGIDLPRSVYLESSVTGSALCCVVSRNHCHLSVKYHFYFESCGSLYVNGWPPGIANLYERVSGLYKGVPGLYKGVHGLYEGVPGLYNGVPGLYGRVPGLYNGVLIVYTLAARNTKIHFCKIISQTKAQRLCSQKFPVLQHFDLGSLPPLA